MWTQEKLQERAKVLFNSEWVSPELNAKNQENWIKAVTSLGDKWLFAKYVGRKCNDRSSTPIDY